MSIYNLQQIKVIITRPQPQAQKLCHLIQSYNGIPICLPLIAINPVEISTQQRHIPDWLIFISQNAVHYGGKFTQKYPQAQIASIGKKTTKTLQEYHIKTDIQSPSPYTSETLLKLPVLQQIKNKHILIIKGGKGRNVLFNTLLERGAKVQNIDVYQRNQLSPSLDFLKAYTIQNLSSIITSGQILDQFHVLLRQYHLEKLKYQPLIVISPRLKEKAHQLGFRHIFVAKSADNQALIQVLNGIKKY